MTVAPQTPDPFEKLSIFFPMWNEEQYIDRAVHAAREVCVELVAAGQIRDYELIVVDDASTDATPQIADAMAADDPHVRVVHHPVEPQARRLPEERVRRGDRRRRAVHRRGPAVRDDRAGPRPARAAHLRGRHGQRVPAGPHRRGAAPGGLLVLLQRPRPAGVRHARAGHQLRVQALPPAGARPRDPEERELVHRRRAGDPGAARGVPGAADRRGLLPADARGVDAVVLRGDPGDGPRDAAAAGRAQDRRTAAGLRHEPAADRDGRRPGSDPGRQRRRPARARRRRRDRDVAARGRAGVRRRGGDAARGPDARARRAPRARRRGPAAAVRAGDPDPRRPRTARSR